MELLMKLLSYDAPSGNEETIASFIKSEITEHADEVKVDALGNLIALKRGKDKVNNNKIMLTANMDESGLMVTVIEDNGIVRFALIGDYKPSALLYKKVAFSNGSIGIIGSEKDGSTEIKDMYIDPLGNKISVGDVAVFVDNNVAKKNTNATVCNKMIASKCIDNRVGCYILIELLKSVVDSPSDIFFVFTVQEKLSNRGAKTAAYSIDPDYAINVGITPSFDVPGEEKSSINLGKGPAIKIKDGSIITHPFIKEKLINSAEKLGIEYQFEVSTKGLSDAGAVHLSRSGVPSGAISIPVRYLNTGNEVCSICDIKNAILVIQDAIIF